MNPAGGTEILLGNLQKYIGDYYNKINIITSVCDLQFLSTSKINVLWQHVNTDQRVAQGLHDSSFVEKLNKIIFVSDWQKNKFIKEFNLPERKCIVLKNAIEPIPWIEKNKTTKIKLIYTSTPWRGLDILVDSFKLLNRSDIELDVYSSTVIYGSNFMKNDFKWLYHQCRTTKGINYRGYALNKAVRRAVQEAHIFSYPSIFEETSCLAAIEAGAAGCSLVLTNLGALSETCDQWGNYLPYIENRNELVYNYATLLNQKIDNYWNEYEKFKSQSDFFNNQYSWLTRKNEWINLIEQLTN